MKYLRQISIIFAVTLIAEIMRYVIPLPVPACVYGLLLMLFALKTGIVALASVRDTARFLIDLMPLMFIPPAVGLLETGSSLKGILLPITAVIILTTFFVAAVTGQVAQCIIRFGRKREEASK